MKILLILCVVIAATLADQAPDYDTFRREFDKRELPEKDLVRRRIQYFEGLNRINQINAQNRTYKVGLTKHTDRNAKRFVAARCKLRLPPTARNLPTEPSLKAMATPALPSVDWSNFGTPVKAQGDCGSCWAFATIATLEFYHKLRNIQTPELSQQNLVDCSTVDNACDGGWPGNTFKFIKQNMGAKVAQGAKYPYTSDKTLQRGICNPNTATPFNAAYQNFTTVRINGDENKLRQIISNVGPVVLAMHITESEEIPIYTAGVFKDYTCPPAASVCDQVNHAVVGVGYGTDPGTREPYIKIRNSWSSRWGENGYVRWLANGSNNCGIACYAMYIE